MERSNHVPPRRPRWAGNPGSRGRLAPCLAVCLASGLALFCAACLPTEPVGTPPVALDDGDAAMACEDGRTAQGPALAVPAAQLRPPGAGAGPAADVPAADAAIFRATYDLSAGSGTLTRVPLVRGEDGAAGLLAPVWDAAALLDAMPPAARRIYTLDPDSRPANATIPFEWARLSAAQRAALDRAPAGTAGDGLGAERLAWLRGERALEGDALRRRAGLLGDAVHGTPLYVGAAADGYGDAARAAFYQQTLQRRGAVYLGANDGMLHAFDAATGAELFAYVPAMLFPVLGELAAPGYTHRAYVDGPLAGGEAFIRDGWRSVLVAAPGAGAQGLFALDITDPAAFGGGLGALWEFTGHDDAAIGNVMGAAQVGRLKLRTRNGAPQYRHFAIAGNGLNSYVADGAQGDPHGALFLLALDKPPAERWRLDTNYYRLDTPPGDPALPAGLGPPALVTDDKHVVRHAYAGDLQGRLWRFDFTRNAPWRAAPALQPVFVARDVGGRPQPITQAPRIVHAEGGGYLVLFGTGSLYGRTERDPARFAPQSYYAIHDDPAATPPA
ncbi:MAG TPA: PilC/PilY family type IV pilus protein, partial [Pseudoduganella sp.]